MASKRVETAQRYIGQFATLDLEILTDILADDYVHQAAPASLNLPGPMDKQGMLDHIGRMRNVLAGFPVTAKEYVESESSNQVTVWATSRTIFHDEVKDDATPPQDWDYEGEYIFLIFMDDTGEKVVRTVEFLDSKKTEELRILLKRARETREKRLATQ